MNNFSVVSRRSENIQRDPRACLLSFWSRILLCSWAPRGRGGREVANLRKERSSMADIYQSLFKTERCMVKSEQVRTGNKVTGPAFGPKVFSSMPQINGQLILELLLNASCAR